MENQNELLKKIGSNDPEAVLEAIREIKENGDHSIIVPLLDILSSQPDTLVVSGIVGLLADIRESSFRDILLERIRQEKNPHVKATWLRIAWESSLDYSGELDLFTDILLNDDFVAAFEASTLIENFIPHLTEDQLHRLRDFFGQVPEDKQFLVENIIEEMEHEAE